MGALLGGPYNTPPIRGTLVDTMVSKLEQRRLSSLGLQKGFLFRGSGWDSWIKPREVEVEENGLWKWDNPLYGSPFVRGPEGYERKALGMSFFLMAAHLGHLEWAPLPGSLRCG